MGGQPEHEPSSEPGAREAHTLAELFPSALIGEATRDRESSGGRVVQAYEFIVDPSDAGERRAIVLGFCMQAAALGYDSAFPTVTLPGVGYRDPDGRRPLSAVYFFVTTPSRTDPGAGPEEPAAR